MFEYGDKELSYLRKKDKKLAYVIDTIGYIDRHTDTDLFSSVIHHIIGQQISSKAQKTVWQRLLNNYDSLTAENICNTDIDKMQSFGMTFKKAEYIKDFAQKIVAGEFDLDEIAQLSDEEAIIKLSQLKGIGVWTAEMLLLFCLQRPNIFSYGDLAIVRALRMIYHHKNIDKKLFEKYRKRFSPYGSVASLYLWAVSNGCIEDIKEYPPKINKK